jgi:hypothetical protein
MLKVSRNLAVGLVAIFFGLISQSVAQPQDHALHEATGAGEPHKKAKSPNEIVQVLQKHALKVKELPPTDRKVESLAGYYTMGRMSVQECYLFSDASYIYTQWDDVSSETIYEKGTWSVKDGFIVLNPDGSVPPTLFPQDHAFAPLRLNAGADVHLMGNRWFFSYFGDNADADSSEYTFNLGTLKRHSQPSRASQEEKRKELMSKAWKPDFFKKEDGRETRR